MNKDEIIALIKEKLSLSIFVAESRDYYAEDTDKIVKVAIYFDGELIDEAESIG